ncbi:type 2 lanthipeptide synthetase LanM family protein [Dyella nitratireducens]|uniref:Lanthionine synthetase n=1 Tax=Dyella nitratireducens TaxID=1849580 RepID=A0ABQ1FKS0_9GAMM|nr:type 2 lanthipeptide synthetase LanM family protein [Dyella nitratireducens]GGA17644.1 lanthionine synthetase [Dyella nitratireducens]GLQ44762.1 lanthionine synthetase [Dyella nitratireducens]
MSIATETNATDSFAAIISGFTAPVRAMFSARLAELAPALLPDEIALIRHSAEEALNANASFKLSRVLLLELHAAKRAGELTAHDDAGRFAQFVEQAQQPAFLEHLNHRYSKLQERLLRALNAQRSAIEALTTRFAADRSTLAQLPGHPHGSLIALSLGQGDLHGGGQSVAKLSLEDGEVIYKPRSLRIDHVLETFLARVFGNGPYRIRVPEIIDCGDYGWAEFVSHRYCSGDSELCVFYRNLGAWLAILRVLGGTDIHHENLIACGPVPVVIDVESLFSMMPKAAPSTYGDAFEVAAELIRNSVLRTGIVPYRAPALGFFGVDMSGAGALSGEQPQVHVPVIAQEGTTDARLDIVNADLLPAQNHPSREPDVSKYWNHLSDGFLDITARLRRLDAKGELAPLLADFEGCQARDIRRPTQAYVEIGRMLWHPASLYDEPKAIERARDLLTRNAAVVPQAPASAAEINVEIDDLRYGDIPIFAAPLTRTRIDEALADWRAMRLELEELTIRSALVATHLNLSEDQPQDERNARRYAARHPHAEHLDQRRRKLAAEAVERLLRLSVHGKDHSVTWITPEINRAGWQVQPLATDLYFGLTGVIVALAGYLHETAAGCADAVPGVEATLAGALQTLRAMEEEEKQELSGGFTGYGAQIWTWLSLHSLQKERACLDRAVHFAEALERLGFEDDKAFDILGGASGAIVPLLGLAEATQHQRWLDLAARAANHLEATATIEGDTAYWPTMRTPDAIGGFAHGSMGIAWSLARLVLAEAGNHADRTRWSALAERGFQLQQKQYDETVGNWFITQQGIRRESFHNWCYGSVGIGMAAGDLYARSGDLNHLHTLRRAVAAARDKWGSSHTLCHGDFSLGEWLVRAAQWDPEGCALDAAHPVACVVSAIEEHGGIVGGMARDAFTPGLMTGLAGAIYSLNRMHPDCTLPSPLLLETKAP